MNCSLGDDGPAAKRLRSDVEVTVALDGREGTPSKTCWLNSQVLASHSKLCEEYLSDNKDNAKAFTFLGLTLEDFEVAYKFVKEPKQALCMTTWDVIKFAPFYHRYHFQGGLDLCDEVLARYIGTHGLTDFKDRPENIEHLVDIISLPYNLDGEYSSITCLPETKKCGIAYMATRFETKNIDTYDSNTAVMFTEQQIVKLLPLLKDKLQSNMASFISRYTMEDVAQDKFPATLENDLARQYKSRRAVKTVTEIFVDGGSEASGRYIGNKDGSEFRPHDKPHSIKRSDISGGDWAIHRNNTEVLWKCPNSRDRNSVPKIGWIVVDAELGSYNVPTITFTGYNEDHPLVSYW